MTESARAVARHFRLRRGMDLQLEGSPGAAFGVGPAVRSVALLGADYPGIRLAAQVAVGERVELGQALMHDRHDPALVFAAPGTGTVSAIEFGDRRRLSCVVVTLEDDQAETPVGDPLDVVAAGVDLIRQRLLTAGLWAAFRTRPFSRVPASGDTPEAIFVTAMDTAPLAGEPRIALARNPVALRAGVAALARLTPGPVYVCRGPGEPLPLPDSPRVVEAVFSGPHPAGLPGTHIHHLRPVDAARTVWHVDGQDVIAIGQLMTTGVLDVRRVVALGGAVAQPCLLETRLGAAVTDLVPNADPGLRVLAGDPLTGREAQGAGAWLGRYHRQIAVLREAGEPRALGWLAAALARAGARGAPGVTTTRVYGRLAGMLPMDAFERVLPLDILPSPLLRSLLLGDTDTAVQLGCLELDAEDLALCSYLCPARQDYGAALRATLDDYRRNG